MSIPSEIDERAITAPAPDDAFIRHWGVIIVGSGFAGLGMAIALKKQGYDDFVVIERNDDIGGTWLVNTYPGAGCDVPSNLYSYEAEPNPGWSRSFASQPEILEYLHRVADDHDVRGKHIFGCDMLDSRWNEATRNWEVSTTRGRFTANIVISATGGLCEPNIPKLPGIDNFAGPVFHSAQWDHDAELTGKRVAIIGTGASSIQVVPGIASDVQRLHVYQRSAPWILPRMDRPHTGLERYVYRRFPLVQRLMRNVIYAIRESWAIPHTKFTPAMAYFGVVARVKLWLEIRDRALREKVRPRTKVGCMRMLPSNAYYPALCRDNVDVITGGVAEIREHSIIADDGTEREVDAIVLCTGFLFGDSPRNDRFHGRRGRSIREYFDAAGSHGYKGSVLPGFPNMLMFFGPNSALGFSSALYMIEAQITYFADAIATFGKSGLMSFEVRQDTVDEYNREVDSLLSGSVWYSGCRSWFLDKYGRNAALWPDFSFRYRRRLQRFDVAAYDVTYESAEVTPESATVA